MTLHVEPDLTDGTAYYFAFDYLSTDALPNWRNRGSASALADAVLLRDAADLMLTRLIADYVEAGWTLQSIGEALGVSKQAVSKRHGRRAASEREAI